jgi:hypothetical protein
MDNIAAQLASKYGTRKVAIDPAKLPQFMLDSAGARRWDMPDPGTYENQAKLYTRLSWVYSAVKATAERAALQDFNVKQRSGEDLNDIPNHPFELLLEKPNPKNSQFELMRDTYSYGSINGNAYWWLNKTGAGGALHEDAEPKEIWVVPSWRVMPVPDENMYIKGYAYDPGPGREMVLLPTWQIVHFSGFNPLNEFVGLSDVEPIGQSAATDIASQEWSYRFFKGNARLPGILAFKDQINNEIAWERIKNDTAQAAEMRNLMLLRGVGDKVEWLKAAATQEEMQQIALREFTKEEIFSIIAPGLASMLAINATEANSKAGRQTWLDVAIYPRLVAMQQKITTDILPAYGDKLVGEFDDPRQTDRVLELQEQGEFSKTHTIDEIRQEVYQDDPIGDERGELLPAEVGKGLTKADSAANTPPQLLPFTGQEPMEEPEQDNPDSGEDEEATPDETKAALKVWERKAINSFRSKGSVANVFHSKEIPPELHASIWAQLSACKSGKAVREVFREAISNQGDDTAIEAPLSLVDELKRANDLLERAKNAK